MALLHLQSSFITNKLHPHLYTYKSLSYLPTRPKFTITCQDSSSSSSSSQSSKPTIEEKPISSGQGFGSGSAQLPKSSESPSSGKKKQQKGRRERASIIRRSPVEKPAFLDKKGEEQAKEDQLLNENAFLLTWLGLGIVILVEGIALAASGFLPEEWDKFFVKFLYPSFTPTVFLFVAGTVVYGVLKYLQNENVRNEK